MPKKSKKGKKDGKSGKGKKGKKGSSKGSAKEESLDKMQERNSNIWEAKLKMAEFHKEHYKDTARQLVEENTSLLDYMKQTEKDTMEVVGYLRKIDTDKETEIAKLEHELKNIHIRHQSDRDSIIKDFNLKLNDFQERLDLKTNECSILQNELNQLKEFRKKKVQMQKELEEIKEAMVLNEKEHKEHTNRVEQKFFEEKMRLQIEANKKIEELAQKAHDAAIKNLDDVTKNVYKENMQLTESFKLHSDELEQIKKHRKALLIENEVLNGELNGNNALVKEKVDQSAKQARLIRELQSKVEILEKSLSQVVREFESERETILKKSDTELESSRIEIDKLNKTLELKTREMNKVKKLAKNILEERSDLERFFLDSLDYVKKQIVSTRNEYRKEAHALYNNRMLAAHNGQIEYPKIRTFTKKFDAFSTNNVYKDLEQAEKWHDINDLVDLADLTWEQKEQVLRELFARMNGAKSSFGNNNGRPNKEDQLILAKIGHNNILDKYETDDDNDSEGYFNKKNRNKMNTNNPKSVGNSAKALAKAMMNEDYTFITQSSTQAEDIFNQKSALPEKANNNSLPKLPSISTFN